MAAVFPVLALLVHAALVALAAPWLEGVAHQAAARLRRDPVPSAAQPWRDLVRLWRKPALVPAGSWFPFAIAPPVALAAAATAALLVPSFTLGTATAGLADLVVVLALLALSRAAPALAAFDAAAPQPVHVAMRGAAGRLAAEPVALLALLVVALLTGSGGLEATPLRDGAVASHLPAALAGLALLAWATVAPPDPPVFAGRHLALLTAAAQLRRVAALSLAAAIGLPFGLAASGAGAEAWVVGACCWAMKLAIMAVLGAVLAPHRILLPAAVLLALMAAIVVGVQGRA